MGRGYRLLFLRPARRRNRFAPPVALCRTGGASPGASRAFVPPVPGTEPTPRRSAFPCRGVPPTPPRAGGQTPVTRAQTPPPHRSISPESAGYLLKIVSLDPCTRSARMRYQCVTPVRREPVAKRRSARQREAKRRREEMRREAAFPRCPICNAKMPSVITGRQVTCGADRCKRERRRRMTRARVARFRTRRRARDVPTTP